MVLEPSITITSIRQRSKQLKCTVKGSQGDGVDHLILTLDSFNLW